jgi:uncharacterized lipoprotein YddW (UPF0748 family)
MLISRRRAVASIAASAAFAALAPAARAASRLIALSPAPALPREFRAAWVATVDNIDWPSRPALPAAAQREEIRRIVQTAGRCGLNALILQVRPTADSVHRSSLEPWSAFVTGVQGKAPSPAYDPLEAWLEEAHDAGLDLHAWVNPFRARHPKSIGPDARTHVANARPDLVRKHGPYLWLDPGHPEAREHSLRVIEDLLRRYPVDGVHMDDYFYPYPRDKEPFPDAETHARFGRGATLSDWRRENINAFIRDTGRLVREHRPGALLTISPFGIWRPNNPPGIKGFDAYEGLHADSRRWLAEGWCDALMPQLYWPIESPGQPFEPLLDWWRSQNKLARHLWPGLYLTRIKPTGEKESWEPDQIERQIATIRSKPDATGFALFSMVGLLENRRGVADRLAERALAGPAVTPASPWLGADAPAPPSARLAEHGAAVRITPRAGRVEPRRWAVQARHGVAWTTTIAPASTRELALGSASHPPEEVIVTAIGPNGVTAGPVTAR